MAEAFLNCDVRRVWEAATPDMRTAFGSVSNLAWLRDTLLADYGSEEAVLSESIESEASLSIFTRLSRWSSSEAPLELVIAFDSKDSIAGFVISPQPVVAQSPFLDYLTKAHLRLPFNGEWHVYWGGRTISDNYHATDLGQRFALDVLILQDGQSHKGDASSLASYYCWDQPVLAPARGVVVRAVDGLPDQAIGSADMQNPAGNHVVIDLGNGEYAFIAHFRQNSVRVATGDHVVVGQQIGRCGNSGNTSEPHVHFHVQKSPDLGFGEGLPAHFRNYWANGIPLAQGEPRRGETIRPSE